MFPALRRDAKRQHFPIFALLSDLDLVLTSDHEWCIYEELSGIAIHRIVGGDDDEVGTTARFTWNGQEPKPDLSPRGARDARSGANPASWVT